MSSMVTPREDEQIRPRSFDEYIGQTPIIKALRVYVDAAKGRGEALDHVLFFGPPGLGKTTLAQATAYEMGSNIHVTSAPALKKPHDLAGLLEKVQERDVFFIDEIHSLTSLAEEMLYSAMEDYRFDIIEGRGRDAYTVNIKLPRFTLIGATTRSGAISAPLRRRFGIALHLEFYKVSELVKIIRRTSDIIGLVMDDDSARMIAERSKGSPSIANNRLKRVRDFAQITTDGYVNPSIVNETFKRIGIDPMGLEAIDLKLMRTLTKTFKNQATGINALSQVMGEDAVVISRIYEPYLIKLGFLVRTKQGRKVTDQGIAYLKLKEMA